MRIRLVVAARKDSGAGAVAVLTCRALRAAGADASLLHMAGRDLEQKLAGLEWADAGLRRERSPRLALANLTAIRRAALQADVMLCHLPHDHLLCLAAGVRRRVPLIRAFRHPRHLRRDPYRQGLARRCEGALLAHRELGPSLARLAPSLPAAAPPVPLADRFRPLDGGPWRRRLGLEDGVRTVGTVGKIDRGRGFDTLLDVLATLPSDTHAIAVGTGPLQPSLAARATAAGLGGRLHWVGFQEAELPALYAAMDAVLFLVPGSDRGHRMISEAQGCGRPVVAADVAGVRDLVAHDRDGLVAVPEAAAVAAAALRILDDADLARRLGENAARAAADRRFEPAGRRLLGWLETVVAGGPARTGMSI